MRRRDALAGALGFLLAIVPLSQPLFHWNLGDAGLLAWVLCPAILLWFAFGGSIVLAVSAAAINGAAFAGLSAVLPRPALRGKPRVVVSSILAMYWLVGVGPMLLYALSWQLSND